MNPLERAQQFVNSGGGPLVDLLHDCMTDGSINALCAVQLLFEDMYDDMTYNLQLKAPAGYCLLRWGKAGMQAMVEAARRTPKSKNYSITLEILSAVASGQRKTIFAQFAAKKLIDDVEMPPVSGKLSARRRG